jgi:hypothetical protein
MDSIKSIFEEECAHIKIDKILLKKVSVMEASFVNKKQEHIEFFGGSLTGVQTVRFTDDDRDKLFIDILEVDDHILEDRLHALKDIEASRIISSDVFNLSCIWLIHAFDNSKLLDEEQRNEGKLRVCLYLQYKFLTSILFRFFRYPADPEVAAATYAQLSYKYVLKQQGSWGGALKFRANEVIAMHSIWATTIKKLDDDYRVVQMLNDVQGRVKDMLKNIMALHMKVSEQGTRISSNKALVETDGEIVLKDKTKNIGIYTRYIRSIIPDKNSFIRQELVDVVANAMLTMPPKLLVQTLEWCSTNYRHLDNNIVEEATDLIMEYSFDYLSEHKELLRSKGDLVTFITKLRGSYMSSRSTDEKLMRIRDLSEQIVNNATKTKNESVIASVRTGFMLYINLRAFCRSHYSKE